MPVTVYVDKSALAGGNGETSAGAFRDLQDALDDVQNRISQGQQDPITVKIAKGIYTPGRGSLNRDSLFVLNTYGAASGLTITLEGELGLSPPTPGQTPGAGSDRTVLSADLSGDDLPGFVNHAENARRIFAGGNPRGFITVRNIEFRGANQDDQYGLSPVYLSAGATNLPPPTGTNLIVSGCSFVENQSKVDSALFAIGFRPVVERCRFDRNNSASGPGALQIFTLGASGATISFSNFYENRGTLGGAIATSGELYVSTSTFFMNHAAYGGAVFADDSVRFTLCLFAQNRSDNEGGAIFMPGTSHASFSQCTFSANGASDGSAIVVRFGGADISNSIVWGGLGSSGPVIDLSPSFVLCSVSSSVIEGGLSGVTVDPGMLYRSGILQSSDPLFIRPGQFSDPRQSLDHVNYRLKTGSSASDIGASFNESNDLDGNLKAFEPIGKKQDSGCYFYNVSPCRESLFHAYYMDPIVNDDDFVVFAKAYGEVISPPANPNADFNHDGFVNDADFSIFAIAYDNGMCP